MFPIVHYYTNKAFIKNGGHFLIWGGLFPDLAANAGINRDDAHQMGDPFYRYCVKNAPYAIPLAKGILGHGIKPFGMDYYADEYWPGGKKGWCFQKGEAWNRKVGLSTSLPEKLWYWKAHNFIEMSLDLLMYAEYPQLREELLIGLDDGDSLKESSIILGNYLGIENQKIVDALKRAVIVFSLIELSPLDMAKKQAQAFIRRHNVYGSDIYAMAGVLEEISQSLDYREFLIQAVKLTGDMLNTYPDK